MKIPKALKIERRAALSAVSAALVLILLFGLCRFDAQCEEVRENVLRMHIIANSDSDEDQALKLKVRDALLSLETEVFSDCETEAEAAAAAERYIEDFERVAEQTLKMNGCDCPVTVSVGDAWFETREYESFTLPAGTYEALKVVIGEGKGKNWWCVMFPAVCLPAVTDRNERLEDTLGKENAEVVTAKERYKVRFKVVEVFEKAKFGLSKLTKLKIL